jgi:hypothetical protein
MEYAIIKDTKIITFTQSFEDETSINNKLKHGLFCVRVDNLKEKPDLTWEFIDGKFTNEKILQKRRQKLLSKIRRERDKLLKECDAMINEITLGIRNDIEDVKDYRKQLLDFTEAYKKDTSLLDNCELTWPKKPGALDE